MNHKIYLNSNMFSSLRSREIFLLGFQNSGSRVLFHFIFLEIFRSIPQSDKKGNICHHRQKAGIALMHVLVPAVDIIP